MSQDPKRRAFTDCTDYSKQLGADYRNLYQLKESGGTDDQIRRAKAKIKADKSRLKNTVKRLNNG